MAPMVTTMALETSPEKPAPLREVSTLVGGYIARLGAVWIEAEVAQLNRRDGICFLTLRDLAATMSMSAKCHVTVLDATPTPITEGARVVVEAKPSYWPGNGSLALEIRQIRPTGEGELLAQLERRKQLLAAEGLFDPRFKKPLPFLPLGIGLVTGKDSAAERDVVQNAQARWPGVRILLKHALMQGPQSARAVINAVAELDADSTIDVIVIARGGGAMEDLLPFSDEALIRVVHACRTPVVSAIGHEPDTPILDFVADLRASTPTDAAKRIVPDITAERDGLASVRERARAAVERTLAGEADRVRQGLERARTHLDHRLHRASDDVGHHLARIRSLSPLATLQRGYAVVETTDGHVVVSASETPEKFSVRLADGHVDAQRLSVRERAIREDSHE